MDVQDLDQVADPNLGFWLTHPDLDEETQPVKKRRVKKGLKGSFTIRGCAIIIKGISCKSCTFKCTGKDLMKDHIDAKHSNTVKAQNVLLNPP